MVHVYIIQGVNGYVYVGQTSNLTDRLKRHDNGHCKSTKHKGPFRIIYTETFKSRSEAMAREKWLKTGVGRDWIQKYVRT